ncbi:uncharacterized protein [Magallana gigas]|uniref:uncharacterized protein n=1 Tax=Magallana gigas TaxID=29159 RepID=UPI003342B20C
MGNLDLPTTTKMDRLEGENPSKIYIRCHWRFHADNAAKQIVYKFTDLQVDCEDELTVLPNEAESTQKYCGIGNVAASKETPADKLEVLYSQSDKNNLFIIRSFNLHMIAATGNETCPQHNIIVTHEKQQITSPRFPGQYAANLDCRYVLTSQTGVVLTFEYIDVEENSACSPTCCDNITIYNGLPSENKTIDSFCGLDRFKPGLTYESKGTNTLTVVLRTDKEVAKRGFVAIVQAKPTEKASLSPVSSTEVSRTQTPSTDDVISSTQIRDVLTTPVVSGLDSTTYIGPCAATCQGRESCYVVHNCTHYKQCYALNGADCRCTLMICPFLTFWNAEINTCDKVSLVDCASDPCLHMEKGSTYSSHFNCRTYYKCDMNHKSQPMCCDKGYAYDYQTAECISNPDCGLECVEREGSQTTQVPKTTQTFTEPCYLHPVDGRPTEYFNAISSIVQKCPIGTVFRAEFCVCGQDTSFSKQECIPLVNVDFKGDHIINLSQQIYIQINNVIKVLFETTDSSYGFFNGRSSSIQIPRLDSVALPRLQIELRFLMSPATTSSTSKYQVLASNCHSKAKPWDILEVTQDLTPSLAIIADTVKQQLLFLAYSDDLNVKPVKIYLPYEADVPNSVELVFNGTSLMGRVYSEKANNKKFSLFSGRIAASSGPLMVGMCSEKDAFYGYMDRVKIFDCLTSALPSVL